MPKRTGMLKGYTLTLAEQETVIGHSADEQFWDVYSCLPVEVKEFKILAKLYKVEIKEQGDGSIRLKLPLRAIKFTKPLSEKQHKARVSNLNI